jgi:hypothetical protein
MATKKSTSSNLEKAIEKMAVGGHNQFADCFNNFLDLALSYFCNNMDERQMELRKYVDENEDFRNAYKEALQCFGDDAEGYHDPLGDIFMSRISHGDHGQFFTPESVSLLMSEIIMGDKLHDGMTINDPACGTGRTLLMALKHLRESKHVEPKLYANDLSMTCAKMTLLNFCINSVDGAVTCGDALRMDTEHFTFFKLDKVRNLTTGAVLTTYWQYTLSDVEKVQEKREKWWWWVAEHGWIKYYHTQKDLKMFSDPSDVSPFIEMKNGNRNAANDPLQTEIKTDENGQLKLF